MRPRSIVPLTAVAAAVVMAFFGNAPCASTPMPSPKQKTSPTQIQARSPKELAYQKALAEWPEVEAKARKEGELVVYGSFIEMEQRAIREVFGKKYPEIKLTILDMRGGESVAKIKAEQAAKVYIADLSELGGSLNNELATSGFFEDFAPPEYLNPQVKWVVDPMQAKKEANFPYTATYGNLGALLINTKLVPPAHEPKSYKDLADPRWKGKLVVDEPRVAGHGQNWFAYMYDMYGDDYLKKVLVDNKTVPTRNRFDVAKMVARGEYSVAFGFGTSDVLNVVMEPGVPLKFYVPQEGATLAIISMGLLKNAPHPHAAKLFMNFRLSAEGQEIIAKHALTVPVRPGIKVVHPTQKIEEVNILPGNPPSLAYADYIVKIRQTKAIEIMGALR